jgi:hypothetical protein
MRIYTTAGQGYEKRKYIRGDLYDELTAANTKLSAEILKEQKETLAAKGLEAVIEEWRQDCICLQAANAKLRAVERIARNMDKYGYSNAFDNQMKEALAAVDKPPHGTAITMDDDGKIRTILDTAVEDGT